MQPAAVIAAATFAEPFELLFPPKASTETATIAAIATTTPTTIATERPPSVGRDRSWPRAFGDCTGRGGGGVRLFFATGGEIVHGQPVGRAGRQISATSGLFPSAAS